MDFFIFQDLDRLYYKTIGYQLNYCKGAKWSKICVCVCFCSSLLKIPFSSSLYLLFLC